MYNAILGFYQTKYGGGNNDLHDVKVRHENLLKVLQI